MPEKNPPDGTSPGDLSAQVEDAQTQVLSQSTSDLTAGRPSLSIHPGKLLAERFRVGRLLGTGGMGEVFEAYDLVLGETVALKVVRAQSPNTERERLRLRREVQLARQVTHRNVCRIYDLIWHRAEDSSMSVDLVSMELLLGSTLDLFVSNRGPLSVDEALPIVRQVARGLNAAHSLGIVHRDLKPANVMLVEEAGGLRAAITDFGLARRIQPGRDGDVNLTQEGKIVGTPAYMVPEQVSGRATSAATDLYSLGIILYEMLSGSLPFDGDSSWQMAINRLTHEPVPLQSRVPNLDANIYQVIDRCLRAKPEERYRSAIDLLEDLDTGTAEWNVYGRQSGDHGSGPSLPSAGGALPGPTWARWGLIWGFGMLALAGLGPFLFRTPVPGEDVPRTSNRAGLDPEHYQLDQLLDELAGTGDTPLPLPALTPEQARDRQAVLERAEGFLKVLESKAAIEAVEQALDSWPGDPVLEARLAEAQWQLGRQRTARDTIARAVERSQATAPQDRLAIQALHQGFHGDWKSAGARFKDLWLVSPKLDVGLWILRSLDNSGQKLALPEALSSLLKQLPEAALDPRVLLWQSRLATDSSEYRQGQNLAQQAIDICRRQNLRVLHLESRLQLLRSQFGDSSEESKTLKIAQMLAGELQWPVYKADVLTEKGLHLRRSGSGSEALNELGRAAEIYRQIGSFKGQCQALTAHGPMYEVSDTEMTEILDQALDACVEGGYKVYEADALHHLARAWRDLRNYSKAIRLFRQSAEILKEQQDQLRIARGRISLSMLLARMGRISEATENAEIALHWLEDAGTDPRRLLVNSLVLAEILVDAGPVSRATTYFQKALDLKPQPLRRLDVYSVQGQIAYEKDDPNTLGKAAQQLAHLAEELSIDRWALDAVAFQVAALTLEGRYPESLQLLADHPDLAQHGGLAVRAYLKAGALSAAADAVQKYIVWADANRDQEHLWLADLLANQVAAANGQEASVERLEDIEHEALVGGHRRIALEARLLLGRLIDDQQRLSAVEKDAKSLGFLRIAAEARFHAAALRQEALPRQDP